MNENTIQELITFIKNASPLMWETLIRQVYSDAITGGIWAFMCLLLSAFSVGMLKASAKMKNENDDYWAFWAVLSASTIILSSLFGLLFITTTTQMLVNPNYYAVKLAFDLVTK